MRPYLSFLSLVAAQFGLSQSAYALECYEVMDWSGNFSDYPAATLEQTSCCEDAPEGQMWTQQLSDDEIWLLVDEEDLDAMNSYSQPILVYNDTDENGVPIVNFTVCTCMGDNGEVLEWDLSSQVEAPEECEDTDEGQIGKLPADLYLEREKLGKWTNGTITGISALPKTATMRSFGPKGGGGGGGTSPDVKMASAPSGGLATRPGGGSATELGWNDDQWRAVNGVNEQIAADTENDGIGAMNGWVDLDLWPDGWEDGNFSRHKGWVHGFASNRTDGGGDKQTIGWVDDPYLTVTWTDEWSRSFAREEEPFVDAIGWDDIAGWLSRQWDGFESLLTSLAATFTPRDKDESDQNDTDTLDTGEAPDAE